MLLNNALNQNFQVLQDSQGTPTSNHTAVRISLRIQVSIQGLLCFQNNNLSQWPGYPSWQDGIRIVDNTAASRPITRARLAHNIARAVGRFMTVSSFSSRTIRSDSRSPLGYGPNRVQRATPGLVGR